MKRAPEQSIIASTVCLFVSPPFLFWHLRMSQERLQGSSASLELSGREVHFETVC